MTDSVPIAAKPRFLDMTGYQWTVLFAAWLGWGFDIFDSLLFNSVAPNCIPTLLGLQIGSTEAKAATLLWTGIITSLLLVGWAIGGIIFGKIADKAGRTKTLLLTMLLYSVGTAACALAPNVGFLVFFRFIASLGIGGEWAAGAAMVAEVVPEKRRVEAGALLYTAAPFGLFLVSFITYFISTRIGTPETSWRWVFFCGLLPAVVAFAVRLFVKEPERWHQAADTAPEPKLSDLFNPTYRKATLGGMAMAFAALLTWWSCNAFLPVIAVGLANGDKALGEIYKVRATSVFNMGGLIGVLLTIPIAKMIGRRVMFVVYFGLGAITTFLAYGLDWSFDTRLLLIFGVGLSIFGIFGAFTFYLPELFPTRLRATGAGFCYNVGRLVAAGGPFLVGNIASRGHEALPAALDALKMVAFVPLIGALLSPFVIETRGKVLED